ncbi:MAG TPA: 1-acyl-sn-glycerol-3-phosphate acyltransferase, partial [Chromatiaceae bacterium]|nr:1-acyl-sn-glycerol-3-phosphate acyltransferase [Chromatiaceae bacterium]
FANASGTVFIRRGKGEAQQVAQAIAHRLRGDRQLAIFPEGRISGNSKVERFFPRLFSAAIDTGTPVVPVALRYIADGKIDQAVAYTPDRHFLAILFLLLMRRRSEVHLIYGEPIPPAGKDRRTLAEEARDAIQAALDSIAVD